MGHLCADTNWEREGDIRQGHLHIGTRLSFGSNRCCRDNSRSVFALRLINTATHQGECHWWTSIGLGCVCTRTIWSRCVVLYYPKNVRQAETQNERNPLSCAMSPNVRQPLLANQTVTHLIGQTCQICATRSGFCIIRPFISSTLIDNRMSSITGLAHTQTHTHLTIINIIEFHLFVYFTRSQVDSANTLPPSLNERVLFPYFSPVIIWVLFSFSL